MKRLLLVLLLITVFVVLSIAYFLWPNSQVISPFEDSGIHLVIEGEVIDGNNLALIDNSEILLSLPVIEDYIDPKVHWDEKSKKLIITTSDKVIKMKTDELTAMVNARPVDLNIPSRIIDDIPYFPVEFLSGVFDIKLEWIEDTNVVTLDYNSSVKQVAKVIKYDAKIRKEPSIKSPIVDDDLILNDYMRVFEEYEDWYKVRLDNGIIGYIQKKFVKVMYETVRGESISKVNNVSWRPEKGKINLVWEAVYSRNPDVSKIRRMPGLDVVSPTWFAVVDKHGTVDNKGDMNYVNWAHNNGYKVWGLITNSFNPDMTHTVLNSEQVREKIINQILMYCQLYNLDGINIDFENIYLKDKNMLTQFIRELVPMAREQELVVSIDVTVKSMSENWSRCFDRKSLAEVVDYVIVMAYDQYWATSPTAGSVAQYKWVDKGIKGVLEEVRPQKLILALPLYTRLWKEQIVNGKKKVTSQALSMGRAQEIVAEKKANVIWDDESGQYYAHYKDGNINYKIWLEEAESINLKSSLVHKYNLAGAASWRRGFETPSIWDVLNDNLKQKRNYSEWAVANGYDKFIFD